MFGALKAPIVLSIVDRVLDISQRVKESGKVRATCGYWYVRVDAESGTFTLGILLLLYPG